MDLVIPDLRFESSFNKSLQAYAEKTNPARLTDAELRRLNVELDDAEAAHPSQNPPLGSITPGIVLYAIVKDQVLMPLLQGFAWAGVLILAGPTLRQIVVHGQRCGTYLARMLNLNLITG